MAVGSTIYIPGSAGVGKYLNTILSGKAAPMDQAGNVGDFWLDCRPGVFVLYGPKQGERWPSTGQSLIGPSGTGEGGASNLLLGHGPPPAEPEPAPDSLYFDIDSQTVYTAA